MDNKKELIECCDVTPLSYDQYELRLDHYISDKRTGKKIRLEEPICVRAVIPVSTKYSPAYIKNETIERMIYELRRRCYESEVSE